LRYCSATRAPVFVLTLNDIEVSILVGDGVLRVAGSERPRASGFASDVPDLARA